MPNVFSPDHYTQMGIEPIEVIEQGKMDYHVASAVAYLMRGGRKGDAIDDYKKALNFLHRRIYGTWFVEPEPGPNTPVSAEKNNKSAMSMANYLANRGRL